MKLRFCYEIKGKMAFLSHLEVMRLWQRAMLRAALPIAWSNGFNPRPKISLGPARNVGVEGLSEYFDAEFSEDVVANDVVAALNAILPTDVAIIAAAPLPPTAKKLEATVNEAIYRVTFPAGRPADLAARVAAFLAADHCPYLRKSPKGEKEIDLRAFVYDIAVNDDGFDLSVAVGDGGTLRVAELLTVFGYWDIIKDIKIRRMGLFVLEGTNRATP